MKNFFTDAEQKAAEKAGIVKEILKAISSLSKLSRQIKGPTELILKPGGKLVMKPCSPPEFLSSPSKSRKQSSLSSLKMTS